MPAASAESWPRVHQIEYSLVGRRWACPTRRVINKIAAVTSAETTSARPAETKSGIGPSRPRLLSGGLHADLNVNVVAQGVERGGHAEFAALDDRAGDKTNPLGPRREVHDLVAPLEHQRHGLLDAVQSQVAL